MIARNEDGTFQTYAWPGGYHVYHLCADGGILCPNCANTQAEVHTNADGPADWRIIASDVNYEDPALFCDHCEKRIESAYGEEI